jgi:hypothetical protein
MAKNIKVKIDVDSNSVQIAGQETLSLVDKVKTLEATLKKVPEGTKEWSTLNAAYKTASADLDKLTIKSKELFDTLGTPTDVEIDIDVNTEEAEGKFVKLQSRIRQTKVALQQAAEAGDTQTFNILKEQLDELQDQFEKTTTQSKKFEDALATVPGPAGMVGKAIKGIDDAFKFLIANPIVAAIAAIGAVLFGMYKALTQTKEGMAVLNKITDAFGNIIQQVVKVVSAIAIPIFEGFAKVIAFVSSAVADATGNYAAYQKELANDAGARAAEKNSERIKKFLDSEGFKFDEITKKKITATQTANEKIKKINDSNESEAEKRRLRQLAIQEQNKVVADADLERAKKVSDAQKVASDKANAAAEKAFNAKVSRMSSEDKLDEAKLDKLKVEALSVAKTEQEKFAIEELYSKKKYELEKKNLLELQSLYKKDSKEYLDYQTQLITLDANRTKEVTDQTEKRKAAREKENKEIQDYLNTLEDLYISTFEKAEDREDAQFEAKRRREKIALTANEQFQKESLDKQAELLKQFDDATEVQQKERREKRFQEEKDKTAKHYSELLQLLDVQGQSLIRGTKAYNTNREEILKASQEQELNAVKVSEDATTAEKEKAEANRTAINDKYSKLRKDQALQEGIYVAQQISQGLNAAKGVAEAILAVNENRMNEELKAAGQDEAKKEEIKKKYFEKNKKTQIALAYINTFQAAVSAFASMAAIPVVGPALGAIAAAAAIVAGLANVAKIKASTYEGGNAAGGTSTSASPTLAMSAPQQASVPNIGASVVSSEGRIGQIVSGASTEQGNRPIQTYVVGSQVSTQQQLDRRVALAAKMPG